MRKKHIFLLTLILGVFVFGGLLAPNWQGVTGAEDVNTLVNNQLDDLEDETGLPGDTDNAAQWVADLIKGILGFVGLIFMVLILYAGFKWMTSGGNSSTIDDAKKMIMNALLGLMIIAFSFAITQFVFKVILKT